ncbi:MAG: hypothetical protein FRX49_13614 [Trebouxia sp. A1-2]|nr:MAG: hypothetical protein FRX49_13614 [Trebouxia sp. A1-2]
MAAQFVYWLSFPVLQETDVVVVQCMVLAHSHFDGILDSDLVSDGWDCAYVVIVKWVMWLMVWGQHGIHCHAGCTTSETKRLQLQAHADVNDNACVPERGTSPRIFTEQTRKWTKFKEMDKATPKG